MHNTSFCIRSMLHRYIHTIQIYVYWAPFMSSLGRFDRSTIVYNFMSTAHFWWRWRLKGKVGSKMFFFLQILDACSAQIRLAAFGQNKIFFPFERIVSPLREIDLSIIHFRLVCKGNHPNSERLFFSDTDSVEKGGKICKPMCKKLCSEFSIILEAFWQHKWP